MKDCCFRYKSRCLVAKQPRIFSRLSPHREKTASGGSFLMFYILKAEVLLDFFVWLAVDLNVRVDEVI